MAKLSDNTDERERAIRGSRQLMRRKLASGKFAYYFRFTDSDGRRKSQRVGATKEDADKGVRLILGCWRRP